MARVWLTNLGTSDEEDRAELFDDGTHGDAQAGDSIFTLADAILPCSPLYLGTRGGYDNWWGFLMVELHDGTPLGINSGKSVGLDDPGWKGDFPVQDFGNSLSATQYAFFIQDTNHKVICNYPVITIYGGTENQNAYR